MTVRRPGLLGSDLAEVARLDPLSGSITFKLDGCGEAELTVAEGGPAINVHDWIALYTQRGLAGIYRVSNVARTYARQVDVSLLHGIDILSDSVWDAQLDFSGTKADYLRAILDQQTQLINGKKPWKLGVCEDKGRIERAVSYDRLSALLEELVEDGGDYCYAYDQTSYPWTVSLVKKTSAVSSEFRLARNVHSASVTYNDADLCTRLILSVNVRVTDEGTGTTSTDTTIRRYDNAQAQKDWGVIVKTADIDTKDDIEDKNFPSADAWAQQYMAMRAEPSVQIQIDGEELYALTGDTWDEMTVGRICQVALPDYGHTFRERVVSVTYPDFLREPSRVTVSLANSLPKFSESIAGARKTAESAARSARSAGRGAASAKELTTWSQHVKYYGEALDGTGILTLYESGIDMDAVGGVTIFSLREGLQALYAGIRVNAEEITYLVRRTGVNDLGENETLRTLITQNAESITLQADQLNSQGERLSFAEISINGVTNDIKLWAKRTEDNEGRISQALVDIDGANAKITLQASRIDDVENQMAAIDIDGANSKITLLAGQVNEQGNLISGVQTKMDGINKTITQQAGEFNRLGNLISGAQSEIDGINKTITDQAGEFDRLGHLVSGAETKIDGINKTITQHAGEFDRLGHLIDGAEIRMDGIEATLNLKVSKDGLISAINLSPESIEISSARIDLSGYVTASALSAVTARFNDLIAGRSEATYLKAVDISGDTVYATGQLSIGSSSGGTLYYRGTQYHRQALVLGGVGGSIAEGHFLGDSSDALNLDHYHKLTAEEENGTIKLTLSEPVPKSDTTEHVANFNIADTKTYKDGVASARSSVTINQPAWSALAGQLTSSRTLNISASNGKSISIPLYLTLSGSYVYLRANSSSGTAVARISIE